MEESEFSTLAASSHCTIVALTTVLPTILNAGAIIVNAKFNCNDTYRDGRAHMGAFIEFSFPSMTPADRSSKPYPEIFKLAIYPELKQDDIKDIVSPSNFSWDLRFLSGPNSFGCKRAASNAAELESSLQDYLNICKSTDSKQMNR